MRPEWHSRAKCNRPGVDPREYDVDSSVRGDAYAYQIVHAVELCEGCPVMRECAQWALDEHPVGVICGGVVLPGACWWGVGAGVNTRLAVERVAAGESVHHAVVYELCGATSTTSAAQVLMSRARAIEAGATPPPTSPRVLRGWGRV